MNVNPRVYAQIVGVINAITEKLSTNSSVDQNSLWWLKIVYVVLQQSRVLFKD